MEMTERRIKQLFLLHQSLRGRPSKRRLPVNKICPICKKNFTTNPSQNHIFCGKPCAYIGRKKSGRTRGSKNKVNKQILCVCQSCGNEFFMMPCQIRNGEGKFCSKECYSKALSQRTMGKNCRFYKDGKSHLNKTQRRISMGSYKYKSWRRKVFRRDGYICQSCGMKSGQGKSVKLNAHHLKSWAKYPKLRYSVSNGITLCEFCHGTNKKSHDNL